MLQSIKIKMFGLLSIIVAAVTIVAPGIANAAGNANLYVQQVNPMVVGSTLTLQIRLNTAGSHVNAVEADFTYPTALLTYVSTDASASAFDINASTTGGSGSVAIARGTDVSGGISGDLEVTNVNFTVLAHGTANIVFQNSSAATDAVSNTNDLSTMTNGSFTDVPGLAPGQTLSSGSSVQSSDGKYTAIMQTDGNFVVYSSTNVPLWSTLTGGNNGARIIMQSDGNLVVYSSANKPLWNSVTGSYPGSEAIMQTDGNFVIYNTFGRPTWSSNTGQIYSTVLTGQSLSAGDFALSANGQYKAIMQSDGNFVVYDSANTPLWHIHTGGNNGAKAIMQTDGNFVVYSSTNVPLWSTLTGGNNGARIIMQSDGNLVVYSSTGKPLWSRTTGRLY